jgi:HPt (histidine-containing phosphotransfer) domain-containing protein
MHKDSSQVEELKRIYRASFTNKASKLAEFISALEAKREPCDELLGEIEHYLHKLAGSLAMYGYSEPAQISQRAIAANDESELVRLLSEIRIFLNRL